MHYQREDGTVLHHTTSQKKYRLLAAVVMAAFVLFISVGFLFLRLTNKETVQNRWDDLGTQGQTELCTGFDVFGADGMYDMLVSDVGVLSEEQKVDFQEMVSVAKENC